MTKSELADIYDRYKNTVYRVALTYLRNIHDAEDIAEEVFLAYFKTDNDFPDDNSKKAWLIRVAINKSKNLLKSAHKRDMELDEISLLFPSADEHNVFWAVDSLPEKYRITIYLYYVEGYSVKEIAKITSRSETAVQTILYRARKQLKQLLKEDF